MSCIIMVAQLLRTLNNFTKLLFSTDAALALFFNNILPYLIDVFALSGSTSLLLLR